MPPFNAYPATIIYTETAANTYTAIGTLADGFPMVPVLDLTVGHLNPVNAGLTTYPLNEQFERGTISSWNVSMQQLLPYGHSLTLGYVANRQNGLTRQREPELRTARAEETASQPYSSITTSSINIQAPAGKVKYDSVQASVSKRMSRGLQYSVAYTYGKTIDWWAGTIPQPEYWYLNKAETGLPHTLNIVGHLRAAIRQRQKIPDGGRPVQHLRRMADQRVLQRAIRRAVQRHRQQCVAQCGRWHQPARRSGERGRGDLWL